ncbi:hypothetical protein BJI67_10885 [Acidihalobacter aeolianus]|uniref:Uncharacterized protein n=1 Tax=Acidihalobacter aeolianus TaxID=2792603 RepID=A0A1D8K946_9GAMM|nr:hypothetical protein [Acidihalobacter aeolianus]AOV17499.1 hypothetical protein BJI67_10885 [Acidihalobacter aeolianus]
MRARPMMRDVSRFFCRFGRSARTWLVAWGLLALLAPGTAVLADQKPVAAAQPLEGSTAAFSQVKAYAQAGAVDLALASIHAGQPPYAQHSKRWLQWEQLKFELLTRAGRWQEIADEARQLPSSLAADARDALQTDAARAWLKLHRGKEARRTLLDLLWGGGAIPADSSVRLWRRLLIEAYLESDQADDARLALLQYQADYPLTDNREREVMSRVWLRVGEPRYALALLKSGNSASRWLFLLASLKAGSLPAAKIEQEAMDAAQAKGVVQTAAARLWAVSAAAALQLQDWPAAMRALEHYLALAPSVPMSPLLPYDGDTLWATYREEGEALGNRNRILLGDDTAWEKAAGAAGKAGQALQARAYNAMLALTGQTPQGRMTGFRWLLTALLAEPNGTQLVDRLFLTAPKTFPKLEALPVPVRLVLANDAVDRHDLKLAARLMVGVNQAPPGENAFDWSLRVARVLILGGKPDDGVAQLKHLIDGSKNIDKTQADRLMQVLFNLQSLKLNTQAIALFQALLPHLNDSQQRREVLFWEGESYQAMGHYREAARQYLDSATAGGQQSYDQWGQTARYNAAQVLAKGGLTGDARRILRDLLARTKAPGRVAFLKQKLAELGKQASDGNASAGT